MQYYFQEHKFCREMLPEYTELWKGHEIIGIGKYWMSVTGTHFDAVKDCNQESPHKETEGDHGGHGQLTARHTHSEGVCAGNYRRHDC